MLSINQYFDGNVQSIGFENSEGRITAGVMAVGEYEFAASDPERMKVTTGCIHARLPGSDSFESFAAGTEFNVDAGTKFQVRIDEPTAYLCFYGG